ncbi:hypothetical protein PVK06_049239 [Gossypium arboreum]|uniref:Uncharacterized protein n=1 Tax=Gossypium arboreum TaxID=29729 RepID=A0ABR0MK30_GOSAR|nr:hypothetical protein PVK06_049239 [Gossypium arboreum]
MLKENLGKEFTPDLNRHGKGIMTKNLGKSQIRQTSIVEGSRNETLGQSVEVFSFCQVQKPKSKSPLKGQFPIGHNSGLEPSVKFLTEAKAANGQGVGPSNVFEIKVTARAGPSSPTEGFRISLDSIREVHLIAASGEAVGGNLAISKNHPIMVNGRRSGVKAFGSKGGWKINKTLKVPGNRFKATESSRVSFAETMKMTANLISLELDRQVVKNLSTKEGEWVDNVMNLSILS